MTSPRAPKWAASLAQTNATQADQEMAGKILRLCSGEPPWVFTASGGGVEIEFENIGSILVHGEIPTLVILDTEHTDYLVTLVKLARQS